MMQLLLMPATVMVSEQL